MRVSSSVSRTDQVNGRSGDIGYQPEQVERKLEDLFTLANRWGCVLLLDEADVFLAKRKVRFEDVT